MGTVGNRWRGLSPFTRWLLIVLLGGCLLANIPVLVLTSDTTVLHYTGAFLSGTAFNDSWALMNQALIYLHSGQIQDLFAHKPLYTVIFFDQKVKFLYPPTSLLLLEPFRLFSREGIVPNGMLNAISWVAVCAIAVIVGRIFSLALSQRLSLPGAESVLLAAAGTLAALVFYPLMKSYVIGQIQTWIDLLAAALVLAWMRRKDTLAGVFSGLICIIKPQLVLLIVWALIRKQWRYAGALALTLGVFLGLSALLYGIGDTLDYLRVLAFIGPRGEACYANQTMNGLLNRMFFTGSNLTWDEHAYPALHPVVAYGTVLSSLILIGWALFWRRKEAGVTHLSIALVSFTMASPIAWEHHYGVLLPVFAFAVPATCESRAESPLWGWVLLGVSYFLVSNYFEFINRTADSPFNILQSATYFGALFLLVHLCRLSRTVQQKSSV